MYITSDLHFLHKRVAEFCPTYRKWDHLHEMTEGLISAWNEKAKTLGTKMYHLGDFCFGTPEETDLIASRLNGDITFIVGNHDYSKHRQVLEKYGEVKYYDEVKYGKKFFVLCHYPIASWNKQGRGSIMLHGHCVDLKTEILTYDGWKTRASVSTKDFVASYDKDNESLIFKPINNIIDLNYSGEVYHLSGRSFDQRVTKGHTMVGFTSQDKYFETPIENVNTQFKIIHSGKNNIFSEGLGLGKDLMALYVSIAADATIKDETKLVRLVVFKERKINYYVSLLTKLGIDFKVLERQSLAKSINFYLPEKLKSLTLKGMDFKLIDMSQEEFSGFYEALGQSDGTDYGSYVSYTTAKKSEVDLIQALCIKYGHRATYSSRVHGYGKGLTYSINITNRQKSTVALKRVLQKENVDNEHFWCIKTQMGNFFMRRNGKVSLTGNCHGSFPDKLYGKMLDVGWDAQGKILHFDEIIAKMEHREIKVIDHHKNFEGEDV